MKYILTYGATIALCGCQFSPTDPSKMTADQLRAMTTDKSTTITCASGKTVTGNVTVVTVNMDQAKNVTGVATVDPDCKTTVSGEKH